MKYLPRMFSHGAEKGLPSAVSHLPAVCYASARKAGP